MNRLTLSGLQGVTLCSEWELQSQAHPLSGCFVPLFPLLHGCCMPFSRSSIEVSMS